MKLFTKYLLAISYVGCAFILYAASNFSHANLRLAILTPDVADIVAALGQSDKVVGIHKFNQNPDFAKVENIGFYRNFSLEPIVQVKPDMVLGSWLAKPDTVYQQLNDLGVKAVNVNLKETLENYENSILEIGKILNSNEKAQALYSDFKERIVQRAPNGKKYIISYDGNFVAGSNTVADTLILLAGGENAALNISGLKPLSREAWLSANPDIIIISKHTESAIGGLSKLLERPEIASSNAGKNAKIIFLPLDDLFRYGLNTPDVIERLSQLGQ